MTRGPRLVGATRASATSFIGFGRSRGGPLQRWRVPVHSSARRLHMNGNLRSVSPTDLYRRLGTASAPVVIDVRGAVLDAATDRLIVGAFHRPADHVERWSADLRAACPVVVYCGNGGEVSQDV